MSAVLQITMKSKEPVAEKTYYEAKPAKKVLWIWFFTKAVLPIVLILFFFGWFLALPLSLVMLKTGASLFTTVAIIIAFAAVLILLSFIYLIFLRRTYIYRITNKGIYHKGGILIKREKFVPFFKITNTEASQGILEQVLKLNTLSFQTAGTGGRPMPEIVFEGLIDIENPKKITYHMIEKTRKASRYDE